MVRTARFLGAAALLCSVAVGKEINMLNVAEAEEYASGAVHAAIMRQKMETWEAEAAAGLMDSANFPELGYTKCINGFAAAIPGDFNNTFRCRNFDLYHFLSHADLGSKHQGQASSSWGWTSADGREFIAIGQYDGTAFAEISSEGKFIYLGRLPQYDPIGSQWREVRVVRDHVVIGSEAIQHGVQIFDLKKLLTLDPANPTTFSQADLAGHWGWSDVPADPAVPWGKLPVGRTHNIVVNEDMGYAMAVGSVGGNATTRVREKMPCNGGIIFLNITDPTNPVSTGCAAGDGYVHDAQCLIYHGPDKRYEGTDICYAYNEDTLTIYDVTNKIGNNTKIIARVSYEGAQYIHQGFVLDTKNQEYLIIDDEFDEQRRSGPAAANGFATTHIFDIRDLENPKYTGYHQGTVRTIDHNQYVIDGISYQSNYGSGVAAVNVSSIPSDPSGASVYEAGFFDIYPEDDELPGGGTDTFVGTWSSYAYFKSGFVFVNTIGRGAFIIKQTSWAPPVAPKCNADNCLRALRANTIPGRLAESQAFCSSYTARLRTEESDVTKAYAKSSCTRDIGLVAQVSSACACLPTATPPP